MVKKKDKAGATELRKRAEEILGEKPEAFRALAPADIKKLIQELNVYQIELELQNEELRRTQLELQEARDKYLNLYDFAPTGYFTLDHNSLIVDVNLAGSELLGSEKHRLIGTQFTSSISPGSQDAFYLHHRELLKTGNKSSCGLKMLKADGTLFPAQLTSMVMTEKDGNINQFRTAVIDITERKQMDEVLEESEERYRTTLDIMDESYYELDLAGNFTFVNDSVCRLLGYSKEELIGMNYRAYTVKEDISTMYNAFNKVYRTGEPQQRNIFHGVVSKDGKIGFRETSAFPKRNKKGEIIGFRGISIDITERKQMQDALKESEERYRTIMEEAENSYFEVDLAGNFTFVSDAACHHLGYSREELIGMNYRVYTPPEDVKKVLQVYNQVYRTGEPVECLSREMIRKDGRRIFIETSIFPLRNERGEIILFRGAGRDVTKRKQVEEKLLESEEKYRSVVERANDGICIIQDGTIKYLNARLANMWGEAAEKFVDTPFAEHLHSDDLPQMAERYKRRMAGEEVTPLYELALVRSDGSKVYAEVNAGVITYEGKPADLVILRDITERKQLEEEQSKLERMKTEFLSNISHELRTPLQSITGFTKLMLQGKVPDPETQKEFLTIIDSQSENLCGLIESLLDMSRIESCRFDINKAPMSLRDLIQDVVHGFHNTANAKNIALTEDIPAALPEIEADEGRLRQVMTNLLGNAIKFSKDGGKITVKAEAEDSNVLVQVTDCGIGIPKEAMKHLFEKFYQGDGSITRGYGGSGLGLYISKQIIEAHGGRIWAESKPGKKTKLAFIIPRVSKRGRKKIGEILVEDGLITDQDLAEALRKQEGQK
jgi:PAS domain S-box-containing protein